MRVLDGLCSVVPAWLSSFHMLWLRLISKFRCVSVSSFSVSYYSLLDSSQFIY